MNKLKQRWQGLKYWQKGGLIGAGIILLVNTIAFSLAIYASGNASNVGEAILFFELITIGIPIFIFVPFELHTLSEEVKKLFFIWSIFAFYLIGALIGLIIGKVKGK